MRSMVNPTLAIVIKPINGDVSVAGFLGSKLGVPTLSLMHIARMREEVLSLLGFNVQEALGALALKAFGLLPSPRIAKDRT